MVVVGVHNYKASDKWPGKTSNGALQVLQVVVMPTEKAQKPKEFTTNLMKGFEAGSPATHLFFMNVPIRRVFIDDIHHCEPGDPGGTHHTVQ